MRCVHVFRPVLAKSSLMPRASNPQGGSFRLNGRGMRRCTLFPMPAVVHWHTNFTSILLMLTLHFLQSCGVWAILRQVRRGCQQIRWWFSGRFFERKYVPDAEVELGPAGTNKHVAGRRFVSSPPLDSSQAHSTMPGGSHWSDLQRAAAGRGVRTKSRAFNTVDPALTLLEPSP